MCAHCFIPRGHVEEAYFPRGTTKHRAQGNPAGDQTLAAFTCQERENLCHEDPAVQIPDQRREAGEMNARNRDITS